MVRQWLGRNIIVCHQIYDDSPQHHVVIAWLQHLPGPYLSSIWGVEEGTVLFSSSPY